MIQPTLEEARRLAEGNTVIPVSMEMFSDVKTSIQILKNIREKSDRYFILESVTGSENWGRYSFLGYRPTMTVHGRDGVTKVTHNGSVTETREEPLEVIREILSRYKSSRIHGLPPFTGGFVGYFSYDAIRYFEPSLKLQAKDEEGFRDFSLMLIDRVIAFDHFQQKII